MKTFIYSFLALFGALVFARQSDATETATPELANAWKEYHATLDAMRKLMEETPRFQESPQSRAKAYHTLMEMQAMAYNFAVAPRMSHPRVHVHTGWQTEIYTLGQNAQDFYYAVVFLDGRQSYRMTGNVGDVKLFLLQVFNGLFDTETVKSVGNYDWDQFEIAEDGSFEVVLSPNKKMAIGLNLIPTLNTSLF